MRIWAGILVLLAITMAGLATQSPSQAKATDRYDCVNFSDQAWAQKFFFPGDPNNLDPDKDGIACEGLRCPCSYSAASPKTERHEGSLAAGRISKSLVAGLTRRSPQLQSWSFETCRQIAQGGFSCQLGAQGESISRRLVCRFAVAVRVVAHRPTGRIVAHKCDAAELPHLTMRRARKAMRATAEATAGPEVLIGLLVSGRENRLRINGRAAWITAPDGVSDKREQFCELEISARLQPKTDEVHASADIPLCGSP